MMASLNKEEGPKWEYREINSQSKYKLLSDCERPRQKLFIWSSLIEYSDILFPSDKLVEIKRCYTPDSLTVTPVFLSGLICVCAADVSFISLSRSSVKWHLSSTSIYASVLLGKTGVTVETVTPLHLYFFVWTKENKGNVRVVVRTLNWPQSKILLPSF